MSSEVVVVKTFRAVRRQETAGSSAVATHIDDGTNDLVNLSRESSIGRSETSSGCSESSLECWSESTACGQWPGGGNDSAVWENMVSSIGSYHDTCSRLKPGDHMAGAYLPNILMDEETRGGEMGVVVGL